MALDLPADLLPLDAPDDIGAPSYDDRAEWLAPPPAPGRRRTEALDDEWDGFVAETRGRSFDYYDCVEDDIAVHVANHGGGAR